MRLEDFVKDGVLKVMVRPNAKKTEFLGVGTRGLPRIALKAPPDKGKANKALVSFVNEQLGKKVVLVYGKASRQKTLRII